MQKMMAGPPTESGKWTSGWIGGWKVIVNLALIIQGESFNKHLEILQHYQEENKNGKEDSRNSSSDDIGHCWNCALRCTDRFIPCFIPPRIWGSFYQNEQDIIYDILILYTKVFIFNFIFFFSN